MFFFKGKIKIQPTFDFILMRDKNLNKYTFFQLLETDVFDFFSFTKAIKKCISAGDLKIVTLVRFHTLKMVV